MAVENLITEHIDIWTSAVKTKSTSGRGSSKKFELYGVKKLRELILELAVRGKLVPQDPNDEPASVLLERIAQEKAQLVKEKKLKKPKKLPNISDEEKPFDLPNGWKWVRFPDVAHYGPGKTPATKNSLYWDETGSGIPWVSIADLNDKSTVSVSTKKVSNIAVEQVFKRTPIPAGTMLMSFKLTVGKASILNVDAFHNEAIISVFPYTGVLQSYLFKVLPSRANSGNKKNAIMGFTLNAESLSLLTIPLPPEAEQHRIVAKVDELMVLCDQLEQQTEASIEAHQVLVTTLLDTLTNSADADELMQNWARISEHFDTLFTTEESIDQLKQTILQLAVMGKLVSFGNSRKTMLKELLSFGPRNGLSPKEAPSRTELKVLKLGATSYGSLDLEQSKYVDVDVKDNPYLCLTRGDILIQRGNSANFVGSNVLIQEDHHNYIYPDLMMKLRVNQLISPEFLSLVLSAKTSREHMWKQMTGTSGTMPKISKKVVEGLPIAFPTNKNIQAEVVSQANKLIALCDKLRTRLTDCSETKATLCDVMTQQAY
ncbi:restriction endonuclease subunit S [Vibrio cholerae]|nr:restriction endonuclease subunit S [Vibrio cholerae]